MKARIRGCVFFSVFLLWCIAAPACKKMEDGWTGSIEDEGDVQVFQNPLKPMYGELSFDIEEDLVIGNEEDENYRFYGVVDLALDSRDNLYVLEAGNSRIQKFDSDGNYLQTIGRKGQGPGELSSPNDIFIDSQDYIYVSEGRKMHVFDSHGEFSNSFPLDFFINDFFISADGNIFASGMLTDEEGSKQVVAKLDPDGKKIKNIDEFVDVKSIQKKDDTGTVFTFKAYHEYNSYLRLAAVDSLSFVYAYPSEYRIMRSDREGRVSLIIKKDEPPKPITRSEKDFIIKRIDEAFARRGRALPREDVERACQFPPHRPFFYGLSVDDEGRIYVRRVGAVLEEAREPEYDIFSREGYYIYKTSLHFSPELIQRGYIYDIFTSEETGVVQVKRYKVLNWEQIKKGP